MDIQHLVDRLEDLIDEGRHMPFSKYTMVDEERALEIIDQMRISIPEEIEKAARILQQRDRVLAQANEEAARILQQARSKGLEMLDQDVNVQAAQNRAANIVEQARQQAEQITAEADHYVMHVLSQLEQTLARNLTQVRNGIHEITAAHQAPAVQPSIEDESSRHTGGVPTAAATPAPAPAGGNQPQAPRRHRAVAALIRRFGEGRLTGPF
ncbi:ATP synthase F0 subunit B [bacterium]|nr:ATP synthase F0 subunit B [bacterium]